MAAPPLVRVRRLANAGLLGRRRMFEVEVPGDGGGAATTTVTPHPYDVLRAVIGWDEAALVEQRASAAWAGGTGPWCTAFTGATSDD